MTQTIVQGPEDPLLVLDHQGGSGNPSFVIQQDETAVAYIWWDQVNQVLNMGPASVGSPSLQISSNGLVGMGQVAVAQAEVSVLTVQAGLIVNAQPEGTSVTGGITVDNLRVTGNVELQGNIASDVSVNGAMGCAGNMTVAGTTLTNNLQFVTGGAIFGDVS
jgi:hypothetical protein